MATNTIRSVAAIASKISNTFAGTQRNVLSAANAADTIVRVSSTMNNIYVTVSDIEGRVVSRASGGMLGLKHRQRATPQAGQAVAEQAVNKAVAAGHKVASVEMKGPSRGRGQILRGIMNGGLRVISIRDTTPIPTNGCRPPAARRL